MCTLTESHQHTVRGIVVSIHIGRPQEFSVEGNPDRNWTSGILKAPVDGPVYAGTTNIDGDQQADLEHHGGIDKAVLAYSRSHYESWNQEFPEQNFVGGSFGENLSVAGLTERDICIGDTFQFGDCILQVSQPRQPCWKLSRRWDIPKLAVRVQQTRRTGWYLRVLTQGTIHAPSPLELIERPYTEFTVEWANKVMFAKPRNSNDDLKLAECPLLSESWQQTLLARATKGTEPNEARRLRGDAP